MNSRTTHSVLAFSLALCFLLVSSLLTSTTAKHATHEGHDPTTHQQTWCGWFCAAGQAIQAPSVEPPSTFTLIGKTKISLAPQTSPLLAILPQSRGSPFLAF